jgi:hypothetical protein
MSTRSPAPVALLADAEEPLILTGPPRFIRGEFRLQNPTADKIIVREPHVRAAVGAVSRKKSLAEGAAFPGPALVMRRIVMRPNQSRPVPVALTLDPRTPPGTYHAELVVNDQLRTVVVHVTEEVGLTIQPAEIVLASRSGDKMKKQVVFTNTGNVPISIRNLGTVVLDEELVHCRALRGALSDVGDTMTNLDEFVVALGRRYKKLYESMVLKVQNTAVTVEPGQTKPVELTITLPDKLDPRARYGGYAAISSSNLQFTIVPD